MVVPSEAFGGGITTWGYGPDAGCRNATLSILPTGVLGIAATMVIDTGTLY
ncbi:MAG: hypothetical protein QOF70_4365, partial [Acetobacteraceae bacterium]|nr:hypothetical protein [Acetobacteraceae bacterium]